METHNKPGLSNVLRPPVVGSIQTELNLVCFKNLKEYLEDQRSSGYFVLLVIIVGSETQQSQQQILSRDLQVHRFIREMHKSVPFSLGSSYHIVAL